MARQTPKSATKKPTPKKAPVVQEKPQRVRTPKAPVPPQEIIVKVQLDPSISEVIASAVTNAVAEKVADTMTKVFDFIKSNTKVSKESTPSNPVTVKQTVPVKEDPKPSKVEEIEPSKEEETEEDEAGEEKVNLTKIREMINLKVSEGLSSKVKSLLAKYDAKNASGLTEENYSGFYNDLKKLK